MTTTTFHYGMATLAVDGQPPSHCPDELLERYDSLLTNQRMSWTEHLHLTRRLGAGGQGVVYLSERRGTDNFTLPVALKIFSPARYDDVRSYDEAMERIAQIAARVAQIQQDNLLDVHNFVDRNRIRIMEMEWIDGYDLSRLLTREMLDRTRERVSNRRWENMSISWSACANWASTSRSSRASCRSPTTAGWRASRMPAVPKSRAGSASSWKPMAMICRVFRHSANRSSRRCANDCCRVVRPACISIR